MIVSQIDFKTGKILKSAERLEEMGTLVVNGDFVDVKTKDGKWLLGVLRRDLEFALRKMLMEHGDEEEARITYDRPL